MKKRGFSLLLLLPFALVGMLMSGCSNNTSGPGEDIAPPGVTNEIEAMKYYALTDLFVAQEDDAFADATVEPAGVAIGAQADADVLVPISWGRFVENVTQTADVSVAAGDSVATVVVTKDLSGTFNIVAKFSPDDTATVVIKKPFADQSVRKVMFKRVGRDNTKFWLNWKAMATSLVNGATVNPPADQVLNLSEFILTRPNGEVVTITDPTNFFLLYKWRFMNMPVPVGTVSGDVPELQANQMISVNATLVSSSPDTDIAVLKYGFNPEQHRRMPMTLVSQTDNGDGTFTRVYQATAQVNDVPGTFQAGVLTMSHKTLYDGDPANYSVRWWGMPYRVK